MSVARLRQALRALEDFAHRGGRHRAQRMQRDADAHQRRFEHAKALDQSQVAVDAMLEAPLPLRQSASVESTGHVQHRQQGQADACFLRGFHQRERHRRRIGVGAPIRLVVQIVELADLGVAGFEHLDVELRRDRAQFVRADAACERIHHFAPGPETVAIARAPLGEPRHRALEGVRVEVRHARQHEAPERFGAVARRARIDRMQRARQEPAVVDLDAHVAFEALRQPRMSGEIRAQSHDASERGSPRA